MQAKGMKVVGFIENREVIEKILKHLGIWLVKKKPSAKANAPPVPIHFDHSDSQIPSCEEYLCKNPGYPIDDYTSWF